MADRDFWIEVSKADLDRVDRLLGGIQNGVPKAISGAINKALVSMRTRIVREIQHYTSLRQREIRAGIATRKANYRLFEGAIIVKGKAYPLICWGAEQTSKGVIYGLKSGQSMLIKSAFIAKMPSGHTGVFTRKHGATRRPAKNVWGSTWLPIREEKGSILTEMFEAHAALVRDILAHGQVFFAHHLETRIRWILETAGRSGKAAA